MYDKTVLARRAVGPVLGLENQVGRVFGPRGNGKSIDPVRALQHYLLAPCILLRAER